jgi:hypothetical protein
MLYLLFQWDGVTGYLGEGGAQSLRPRLGFYGGGVLQVARESSGVLGLNQLQTSGLGQISEGGGVRPPPYPAHAG